MNAQNINAQDILARTMYGEARGEFKTVGIQAFEAIGHVVINRLNQQTWFGKTIEEVCLKPNQFSCWNPTDPNHHIISNSSLDNALFQVCQKAAQNILTEKLMDITRGADHYHTHLCFPFWSKGQKPTCVIGNHLFFNLRKKR